MKVWSKPTITELSTEFTKGGGTKVTTHDGKIYQVGNYWVEEYYPES